jgi:hypothetical protein
MNKKRLLNKCATHLTNGLGAHQWFSMAAAITSLLIVTIASCKKENDDLFIIGNIENSDLSIVFTDTVFPSFLTPMPVNYNIDADKDGTNDFRFFCSDVYVNNETSYYQIEISCLNKNSFIGVQVFKDTLFLDTFSGTYSIGDKKESNFYRYYSHTRPFEPDSIVKVKEERYIVPFRKLTQLDGVNWVPENSLIYRSGYSWSFTNSDSKPDWLKHTEISFEELNPFPDGEIRYIAIRKLVKGKPKLGWIKAFLTHRVITVLEVALQK